MKAELKAKWLAALREEGAIQAHGRLRATLMNGPTDPSNVWDGEAASEVPADDPIGYCCLGVLCNVLAPNGWEHTSGDSLDVNGYEDGGVYEKAEWVHLAYGHDGELLSDDVLLSQLTIESPIEVIQKVAGGEKSLTLTSPGDVQQHLAHLNDSGSSFADIADWIEANITVTDAPA